MPPNLCTLQHVLLSCINILFIICNGVYYGIRVRILILMSCLGVRHLSGTNDQILLLSGRCSFVDVVDLFHLQVMGRRHQLSWVPITGQLNSLLKWDLCYDRQSVGQFVLMSGTHDQIFMTITQLQFCWCRDPCLMRVGFCHLQSLLELRRAAQAPLDLWPYFTLQNLRHPSKGARSPCFNSAETGWPTYTPGHWEYLCCFLTTCRAMVEVLDPSPISTCCNLVVCQITAAI
jgi:hypothetical protein